jgi:hypothetical protein
VNLDRRRAEPDQLLVEGGAVVVRRGVAREDASDAEDLLARCPGEEVDLVRGVRRHPHDELVQAHAVIRLPLIEQVDVEPSRRQRSVGVGGRGSGVA